jgi:hypothetical protein
MGMGAVERFVSRRHSEHDQAPMPMESVLDCARVAGLGQSDVATHDCRSRNRYGDRPSNASIRDHVEARLAARLIESYINGVHNLGAAAGCSRFFLTAFAFCRAGNGIRVAVRGQNFTRATPSRTRDSRASYSLSDLAGWTHARSRSIPNTITGIRARISFCCAWGYF